MKFFHDLQVNLHLQRLGVSNSEKMYEEICANPGVSNTSIFTKINLFCPSRIAYSQPETQNDFEKLEITKLFIFVIVQH